MQMCLQTTGFGNQPSHLGPPKLNPAPSTFSHRAQPTFVQAQNEHGYFRPQRPRPQFDMNLQDLFPEDTQQNRIFARNIGQWQAPVSRGPTNQPEMMYQPLPQQQQRSSPAPTFTTPTYDIPPVPNDVLDNPPFDYGFNEIDSLLADTTATYNGQPGLTLGFDSEHNWSDGGQLDLFDGFFFGGPAANGGTSGLMN